MEVERIVNIREKLEYSGEEVRDFVKEQRPKEETEKHKRRDEEKEKREVEEKKLADERGERELEEKKLRDELALEEQKLQHEIAAREQGKRERLPELPTFVEGRDDLDAYLDRFERYAEMARWPREEWAIGLGALLTGEALSVYSRVSRADAGNYAALKKALLDRYQLDAEGFRKKLRESSAREGERPEHFIDRLKGYVYKWIEMAGAKQTFDDLVFLMVSEQFLSYCSNNLAVYLKTVAFGNLEELGEKAHKFLGARGIQMKDSTRPRVSNDRGKSRLTCWGCRKVGHRQRECKKRRKAKTVPRAGGLSTVTCYSCGELGHYASNCREPMKRERNKGRTVEVKTAKKEMGARVIERVGKEKVESGKVR
jgi:hypothetical protein